MNVYSLLFSHWWLQQKRGGNVKSVIITRLVSLVFMLSAIVFITWVARKTLPGIDRRQLLQKSLLPLLMADLLLRFLWARQPGLPSPAYVALNVGREKLIHFCGVMSLLVRFNIITPVSVSALFSLSSLPVTPVIVFVVVLITGLSATLDFVVKLLTQRWSMISIVYPVSLCFLFYAGTTWFLQELAITGNFVVSWAGLLTLVMVLMALYFLQRRLLRITLQRWLTRSSPGLLLIGKMSFGKGLLPEYLALKWKLIFRNSRPRGMFFGGMLFSAYVYFALLDIRLASNAYLLFIVLSFILGHSAIFGIHLFSWFTKAVDFLFVQPMLWPLFLSASGWMVFLFQLPPFVALLIGGWGQWLFMKKIILLALFLAGFPPLLNLFLSLFAARKTDIASNTWWVKFKSISWYNLIPELITGLIAVLSLLVTGIHRRDDLVFRVLGSIGVICLLLRPRAMAYMGRKVESRKHVIIHQLKN